MPDRTQEYLQLAEQTARSLTRSYESWTGFLETSSRLYKYDYQDQLMIYAQRPDATACASYELWNNTMHRYVRRGSTRAQIAQNKTLVHLWCGSKEPYAIKSHNILKRYLKNYNEEIMPGFGHGEFLMKHQKEICEKIQKTLS